MKLSLVIRRAMVVTLAAAVSLGLSQCASTGTTASAATASGDDAQATSSSSAVVTSAMNSSVSGASASVNAAQLMKRYLAAGGVANLTESIDFTESVACSDSGSIDLVVDGDITIASDSSSVTIDASATNTFNECAESMSVTTEDGVTCGFSFVMDGDMTCTLTGSFTETSAQMDFACGTTSACGGITLTLNGEAHTIGLDLTATNVTESGEPTLEGAICVDGEEFDFSEVEELTEFESSELSCN